jgi:gluconokinase
MAAGIPLQDIDRAPWLAAIADRISQTDSFILACSALKESYRAQLRLACPALTTIHLTAPKEVLHDRLVQRASHFMPAALLDSQLETLEPPNSAWIIDTRESTETTVQQILRYLSH